MNRVVVFHAGGMAACSRWLSVAIPPATSWSSLRDGNWMAMALP